MAFLSHQTTIRLGCFSGALLLMTLWEALAPRRPASGGWRRWVSNLTLVALGNAAVRLVVPLGAVGMALLAAGQGWGLLHHFAVPWWAAVLLSVVALDLVVYLQHVLFHAVPLLWRLHMVHHADRHYDATTGVRFHPAEIVLSVLIKIGAVALLGAPAEGVLLFEVLLNATSLFNHGNVSLPGWLEWPLRLVLVTPDMHRVHHSADPRETNTNFGFSLPWWDHLFGTYRARPRLGHERMVIGVNEIRDEGTTGGLPGMLVMPFTGAAAPSSYWGEREGGDWPARETVGPMAGHLPPPGRRPRRVLFVCQENSCRSQMAEAFARRVGAGWVEAYSAGSSPSGIIHATTIEAMREAGYDLAGHRSKSLAEVPDVVFDAVVAMGCGDASDAVRAARREAWDLPKPRDLPPGRFREVRDEIERRVKGLLEGLDDPPSQAGLGPTSRCAG